MVCVSSPLRSFDLRDMTFSTRLKSMIINACFTYCFLGCSGGRPPPLDPEHASALDRSTPQVSEQITPLLLKRLTEAQILLLGETHDHPQHHLIQAEVIKRLKPKTVAFEMVDSDQQATLNQLNQTPPSEWDQVLNWSKRGWPNFELYRPVFEAALSVGARLIAAHPPLATLAPLKLGGELSSDLRQRLKLDIPLPQAQKEALLEELQEAHCGHAPPSIAEAMLKAQRLKDAWMAELMLKVDHPSVLIVGRGHVNPHRGIPWAIENLSASEGKLKANAQPPKVHILSLSPTRPPHESSAEDHHSHLLIAAHRKDDPCERFREQLEQMRKRRQAQPTR